jgi:succinate-semialdehyde dehydrogenase/glutarate-semialdehyde dehydrogenase
MATTQKSLIDSVPKGLFIGGSWRDATGGATLAVEDPSSGSTLTRVADASVADGKAALDAAVAAQAEWAATAPRDRGEILRAAFERITERAEDFATLMTLEMGKTLAESRGEVTYGAEFFRWFSEEAVRIHGRWSTAPNGATRLLTMKKPVGPTLMITPWNFPLAMGTRKIGPAIAAGCTMVFKPANLTPLSSLALVDILIEAGLPAGVLNVVCTKSASSVVTPWMESGIARKISFTGSTGVGVRLLEQAAQHVMRSSMELGGNAPLIVFEDADLDRAVEGAFAAKMRNMGEACTAANRIFVQRSIAADFAERLARRLGALTVGDGASPGTDVGPLVERKALDKVQELVDDAVAKGASVVCGGQRPAGRGYFYSPTVLTDVAASADLMTQEIFGPVAPLIPFDTEDEVVTMANDTPWGLAGYLFTQDLDRAFRVGDALEVGMVGLNTGIVSNPAAPFGGIKASGLGREGGRVGIEEFLETKYMALPRA